MPESDGESIVSIEGNPERFGIECPECGELVVIDDNSTILFLDADDQLWAYIKCPTDNQCDAVTLEVPPEDMGYYSHLASYYNQDGDPVPNIVTEVIEVPTKQDKEAAAALIAEKLLEMNWHLFWTEYDPQPYEFNGRKWDGSVNYA